MHHKKNGEMRGAYTLRSTLTCACSCSAVGGCTATVGVAGLNAAIKSGRAAWSIYNMKIRNEGW